MNSPTKFPIIVKKLFLHFLGYDKQYKKRTPARDPKQCGERVHAGTTCGPADIQDSKLRDTEANLICETKNRMGRLRPTLCASLRGPNGHVDISQEPFYAKILWKNAAAQDHEKTTAHTLHEPAQSKWTRTYHKSHFT